MSVHSSSRRILVPSVFSSSNFSVTYFYPMCLDTMGSKIIYTTYTITNVVLFPVYLFVLFKGYKQWRHHRFGPSGTKMNHSDFFTFQMMVLEIICVVSSFFYSLGTYIRSQIVVCLGVFLLGFILSGQSLFHVLTCVERYLAIVHAIAYMHVRETLKVRIRNISTLVVWLQCFGWMGLCYVYLPNFPAIHLLSVVIMYMLITSFCCLSALRYLTALGPSGTAGHKRRVDPSRRRAFNMIAAIAVTLVLRMFGILLCVVIDNLISLDLKELCYLTDLGIWLTVPSSLVSPVLFLHRAGKIPCLTRKA